MVTEEAVRRPSEAEIRHEEGFEVVTRRRRRRATGEDEVVGGGGWTVQKQQKKDVSFGGGGVSSLGMLESKGTGRRGSNGFELHCSATRADVRHGQG